MLSQMRRSIQLGGLAKDLSGLRGRKDGSVAQAKQRVVERIGTMHGLPQKIGQIVSLLELAQQDQPFTTLTESGEQRHICLQRRRSSRGQRQRSLELLAGARQIAAVLADEGCAVARLGELEPPEVGFFRE